MPPALARVTEGATQLSVPRSSLAAREPETHPIFFNPAAKVNRDVSVALTSVTEGESFCDVLAGIGARGVRIAREVPRDIDVALNDFNKLSLQVAKKNARLNRVAGKCSFSQDEANHFLYSRFGNDKRFDYVDVDPFGSPAPFLQAALSASADRSVVSLTATDTAVLCGVFPSVANRRYGSVSRKSEFKHETAIRLLLHFCARLAAVNDIGIQPILEHSTRHYLRIYFRVSRSAAAADRSIANFGYVSSCQNCGERSASESARAVCDKCRAAVHTAGPLWLGPLTDRKLIRGAGLFAEKRKFTEAATIINSLLDVDGFPPFSYDLEVICSRLKIASVPQQRVLDQLSENGHSSMKQPFEKHGLKTDAGYAEIAEAVRRASSASPQTD